MKLGDTVKMSEKNLNHLGNDVCAFAGYQGKVVQIWEDGAFCIDNGSSELVVGMNKSNKRPKKGVWVYINGVHTFHKRIAQENEETISVLEQVLNFVLRPFKLMLYGY